MQWANVNIHQDTRSLKIPGVLLLILIYVGRFYSLLRISYIGFFLVPYSFTYSVRKGHSFVLWRARTKSFIVSFIITDLTARIYASFFFFYNNLGSFPESGICLLCILCTNDLKTASAPNPPDKFSNILCFLIAFHILHKDTMLFFLKGSLYFRNFFFFFLWLS